MIDTSQLSPLQSLMLNKGFYLVSLFVLVYGSGWLVQRRGVKANYTRKVVNFAFFFLPLLVDRWVPYRRTQSLVAWFLQSGVAALCFVLFLEPIRSRSAILKTMFASFDRPEDRPYTILWIGLQGIAVNAVFLIAGFAYASLRVDLALLNITFYTSLLGDGLAEPVGIRFGRHKYATRGLFVDRVYQRSLEGSACVFVVCVLAILFQAARFSGVQELAALALVPAAVTYVEAKSPHTFDNPLIILVGAALLAAIKLLI